MGLLWPNAGGIELNYQRTQLSEESMSYARNFSVTRRMASLTLSRLLKAEMRK